MDFKFLSCSALLTVLSFSAFSEETYHVTTELQKKQVLLEEFTGIHCGFCPQGHQIGTNLMKAHPEKVHVIAIHTGSYANPGSDEPDFRTIHGSEINALAGDGGYPSGMINRHDFFDYGQCIMGRLQWTKCSKKISEENAPVNLWMTSSINGANRELKVRVEGYYTKESLTSFHLLNIAILQDSIVGPQNGGLVGSDYVHNHMLRDMITGQWGDTIDTPKPGEYFAKEYTYTIPQNYVGIRSNDKGTPAKLENIKLVAFLTESKAEILNVIGSKPEYVNYNKALSASFSMDKLSSRYAYNFFEVELKNNSSESLTSATFNILINGEEQESSWTGTIPAFGKRKITLQVTEYPLLKSNTYSLQLHKLNGKTFQGNKVSGSFSGPISCTSQIFIDIKTDLFADENSWIIRNRNGEIIKDLGAFPSNTITTHSEEVSLPGNGIFCFEIIDNWGNGLNEPYGNASYYKLYNSDHKKLFASDYEIGDFGDKTFFSTDISGIESTSYIKNKTTVWPNPAEKETTLYFTSTSAGTVHINVYDITSKSYFLQTIEVADIGENSVEIPVANLKSGIYFIGIQQNNKNEILKLIVK